MRIPIRITAALTVASLYLLLAASAALAAAPASVTVRVLGPPPSYEALTPPTTVTVSTAPVTKDGGSCSGASAAGALELATHGDWEGTWSSKFSDYEVISIDGTSFPFEEGAPANYYWSFWRNNLYAEAGVCEVALEAGDQILFVPSCFGASCPTTPDLLGLTVPEAVEVGSPVLVTVSRYNAKGEPSPMVGATVSGAGASARTDAQGQAQLRFTSDGTYTLRATGAAGEEPVAIPGEAIVCAHTGNDGACGTTAPSPVAATQQTLAFTGAASPSYNGPYALVAAISGIRERHVYPRGGGPRVLSGTVSSHSSVTSISLRLRRSYHGRCWAYSGTRDRFLGARCGHGAFFQIASGGDGFSYLLPARLPPGRYVLDVRARDSAGNSTSLARGSSRVVFYVG